MAAPPDFATRRQQEEAAWQAFVLALADHLAGQWPAMPERLGERYAAFVDAAVQQALARGFEDCAAVARWVNLCFAWGPAFDEKPGFDWAREILARSAGQPWLASHQLVRRSLAELQRLPGARLEPAALAAADARALEAFGARAGYGRRGALLKPDPEPPARPLAACDLEASELRVAAGGGSAEVTAGSRYRLDGGLWSREAEPLPLPLRVDLQHPLPPRLSMLSPEGAAAPSRLMLRLAAHATCDPQHHPALRCVGPFGGATWHGHEARAFGLDLAPRVQPPPASGAGTVVAEETSPELYQIGWLSCGLRDAGPALGPLVTQVGVWPATGWWAEFQRAAPPRQALLGSPGGDGRPVTRPWQPAGTRTRLERDGQACDAAALAGAFERGLDTALAGAAERLAQAWGEVPGLAGATLEAEWGLLIGRAALAWGWSAPVLEAPPFMRLLGRLDLDAARVDLAFGGRLGWNGASARVVLGCSGRAGLAGELRRESADGPPLAARLAAGARCEWRFPFEARLDPLAGDGGALLQAAGSAGGALVGEAGLRPNTHGASGFEWFAELRLEAVELPLVALDPVAGERHGRLELLAAQPLMAWSLGDG